MADYLIDLDFVATEFEDDEYQEFEIDEGSLATIPAGTGPAVNPYESAGSPASAITISPGDRIQFRWDRISSRTGGYTATVATYKGTSSSGSDSKTLLGATSNTTILNGINVEGTGALTSSYYTVHSGATSTYKIVITFASTRGYGQDTTRTIYFDAVSAIANPDLSVSTTWPTSVTSASFSMSVASGSTNTIYEVRTGSYTGTVVGSRTGSGSIFVSHGMTRGTSADFYLTGRRTTAQGGDNVAQAIETEDVTYAYVAPDDITVSKVGSVVYNSSSHTVSYTGLATNNTAKLQWLNGSTWTDYGSTSTAASYSWSVSGSSFPSAGSSKSYRVLVKRNTASGGDNLYDVKSTFSVSRDTQVFADTGVSVTPQNGVVSTTSATTTFSISNANSNGVTDYRIVVNGTSTALASYTSSATSFNLTINSPTTGTTTYKLQARVPTANNGNNSWSDAKTLSITRIGTPTGVTHTVVYYDTYSESQDNAVQNVWNDDIIKYIWNSSTGGEWSALITGGATLSPADGDLDNGANTIYVIPTVGSSSYSITFWGDADQENNQAGELSGTISDPFAVTNVTIASVTGQNPGATNVESESKTFDTLREGETLDFSVSNGTLEKNNSNTWESSGTINDGDTYRLRRDASSSYSTNVSCTVSFSKYSNAKRSESFTVGTRAQDVTPASFDLGGPVTFQNRSTYEYSNTITVTGIDSDATVAVSVSGTGAAYQKNGGSYTTTAGTVDLNDTLRVRLQNSGSYNTSRTATLTVGGVSDTYKTTTDIYFDLGGNVSGAEKSAYTYKNFTVASSAYGSSDVTFTAGSNTKVSTNNSTWVSSVNRSNGEVVYVRGQASSSYATAVTCSVSGGGTSDSFTITTRAQDVTPSAFTFTDETGINRGAVETSNEITIGGMDSDAGVTASFSGTNSDFRYHNGSVWSAYRTANVTSVANGYKFQIRTTASSDFATKRDATLTVGGISDVYSVTSESAVSPDTSVTFSTSTPLFTGTSFTLTTSGTGSTTDYKVRTGSYTGTVIKSFTGSASNLSISNTPSTAGTTYYVTGSVSDANDGTGVSANVGTFSVTRSSEVTPDKTITTDSSISTYNSTFNVEYSNGNSNGVTDYRLVENGSTTALDSYTGSQTAYTFENITTPASSQIYKIQARVPTSNNGDGNWEDAATVTVTKIAAPVFTGTNLNITYNSDAVVTKTNNNLWHDDRITLFWSHNGTADENEPWVAGDTTNVSVTPSNGTLDAQTQTIYVSFTGGNTYGVTFYASDQADPYDGSERVTLTGTLRDPWEIDDHTFTASADQTPDTDNVSSASTTLSTLRSGETVDFSVSNGTLQKNGSGSWTSSGTITDGDTYKLRGDANNTYSGTTTVTATFSKYSNNKATATFVVNTEDLVRPTGIQITNNDANNANVTVTVTGSGGSGGSGIEVSDTGSTNDYDANGSTYTQARGTTETYYTRRFGLYSQNSSARTGTHTVYPKPPTDLTFTPNTTDNNTTTGTVTVNASGGYGGTLKVTNNNGVSWFTVPHDFTVTRGSAVTYKAKRFGADVDSTEYSEAYTMPYLDPKTFSYTISDSQPLSYLDSGFNVTIAGADASHTYQVLYGSTNAGTRTTNGNISITGSELPSAGSSITYSVRVKRATAAGGNNSYVTDSTFVRGMRPQNPSITVSVDDDQNDSNVPILVSASSVGATEYRFKKGTGSWSSWGSSNSTIYDVDRGDSSTYYVEARAGSSLPAAAGDSQVFAVPYKTPNLVAAVATTIVNIGSNITTYAQSVTGIGAGERCRITSTVGTYTASGDGNKTITVGAPNDGYSATYRVQVRRTVASGGDGTTWYDTNATFTINRTANAAPVIGSFIASPSTTEGAQLVTLTASSVSDSDGTIASLVISQYFGDTQTLSTSTTGINTNNASLTSTFTTSSSQAGTLGFTVTATDDDGATSVSSVLVSTNAAGTGTGSSNPVGTYGLEVYSANEDLWLSMSDSLPRFVSVVSGTLTDDQVTVSLPSYIGDKSVIVVDLSQTSLIYNASNALNARQTGSSSNPTLTISRTLTEEFDEGFSNDVAYKYLIILEEGDQVANTLIGVP